MQIRCVQWSTFVLLALAGCALSCFAQEVCGLQQANFDTIFFDGFNPVPTSGGLGPALTTVSPPTLGQAPAIAITYPPTGASLPGGKVQVMGTVSGPINTGVTVNGVRAWVHNGLFLTPSITLGENTASLEATATTMDGVTASASRSIGSSAPSAAAKLVVSAEAGFAPLPVIFHLTVTSPQSVQQVSIDFDGDGSPDFQGSAQGDVGSFTYAAPGVYTTTATVTLNDASQLTASHKIIALDFDAQRSTVCSVYAWFRARLNAQDAAGASYALTDAFHSRMSALFNVLAPTDLPTVGQGLGTLTDGAIGLGYADIIAVQDSGSKLHGYPIHFVRDAHGVWRIASM